MLRCYYTKIMFAIIWEELTGYGLGCVTEEEDFLVIYEDRNSCVACLNDDIVAVDVLDFGDCFGT